jgi:carbon monoxide dehydrogenase subunit G
VGARSLDDLAGHPELTALPTMAVRAERVVTIPAPREDVWAFIDDPEKRARPISVVTDFEIDDGHAVWHLKLPIPIVDRTIRVETEERQRDPPAYVEFVGRSKVMHVVGEHELEEVENGTRLTSRFVVEGQLPGVERFFKRNMEREFDNLEGAIYEDLGLVH